ncbi:DUF6075 family protein [Campylobacter jejuni]|uniref:DUF6075 family protein n=1 Tax=Campylobacter jejuni TaxID=197 RepID=UPI003B9F0BE6
MKSAKKNRESEGVMLMQFLNNQHRQNYFDLLARDNTSDGDIERQALFFIIAGESRLIEMVNRIYDFKERWIKPEVFQEGFITSGYRALIALGFNLYNGYDESKSSVLDVFSSLDAEGKRLAMLAIALRFRMPVSQE